MTEAKTRTWLKKNADISLRGKTVVVTGANSGVGYKTAETMLYLGARVILACRNPEKADAARSALEAEYPESEITVLKLDLADLSAIDAFVARIRAQAIDIDVFVNNAGVLHPPVKQTKDRFELVIGTNYIGVYYLTEKLIPYLSTLPHEVTYINTISLLHKFVKIDYDDFYCQKRYRTIRAYGRSKICLAKYTYHKAKELDCSNVHVYMSHPGISITPMGINAVGPKLRKHARRVQPLFNSPEKSSLAVAYILAHPRLPAGAIVGPDKCLGGWGYPTVNRTLRKVTTGAEELVAYTEKELAKKTHITL